MKEAQATKTLAKMKKAIKMCKVLESVEKFNRRQQLPGRFIYRVTELYLRDTHAGVAMLQMLPMNNHHVHKKVKFCIQIYFLLSVSDITARFSTYWKISLVNYEKLYASAYRKASKNLYFLEGAYI